MRTMARTVLVLLVVVGAAAVGVAQTCGWEWVNPAPPRTDIYRLKHEVGAFVGVGRSGTVIRSSDGYDWELMHSGVEGHLYGIDWGAGTFVAVGEDEIIASPAGYEWTTVWAGDGVVFKDVEFSMSRFVAIGGGLDGQLTTSTLGAEWELTPVPWSGSADSIAGSDEGFFVAVGTEIWFSSDGFSWELVDSAPAAEAVSGLRGPAKRNGADLFDLDRVDLGWTGTRLFWAGGNELWTKTWPGGDWQLAAELGGCDPWNDWLGLASGTGWVAASGIAGCPTPFLDPTVTIIISVDGGETFRAPWQAELGGFPAITRYGSRWVAAGAYGDIATSIDASTWNCLQGGCTSLACDDGFFDLAGDEERLVAVGGVVGPCDGLLKRRGGATTATSLEGESWQIHVPSGDVFRGVAVVDGGYLGVGDGWIGRSVDGESWTSESSPDGVMLNDATAGYGWVVAVGEQGVVYASDDGASWYKPFLYVTDDLERVVWDEDQFLALGRNGTILRSLNATNWDAAYAATGVDLKGAAAGPDGWSMVGDGGTILASTTGEVWLPRRSGVNANLRDVAYGDGMFLAVGCEDGGGGLRPGVALASRLGVHWTRFDLPGESPRRVRWSGDGWVVAGGDRTLLHASCLGLLIEPAEEHLQVPVGRTEDLMVRLSEPAAEDVVMRVSSSRPGKVSVPATVTVLRGSETVFVPVTGIKVASGIVLGFSLPAEVGGGSTTSLCSVQPPEWTPRRSSGRRTP